MHKRFSNNLIISLFAGWFLAGRGHRVVPHPPKEEGARQADGRVLPVAAPGCRRPGMNCIKIGLP